MNKRNKILKKLDGATNLPSFPDIVVKLSELMENLTTTTNEVVELIKFDPPLAAGVLRLANTLAFNTAGTVSSIDEAVIRIGFKNISDLALSLSIINNFSGKGLINYAEFWNHCLSVAYATQIMEQHAKKIRGSIGNMYTAGLLHDIGILILDQFFSDSYYEVLVEARTRETQLYKIEQEILGIDHSEIGALLLKKWRLPQAIVDTVKNQYSPYIKTKYADQSTKILHMADFACNNQGICNGIEAFPLDFSQSAWFDIGLEINEVPRIIKEVNEQTQKAKEILKAVSPSSSPVVGS